MSVLACARYGCDNIMCDRYSYIHGYICYECFNELVDLRTLNIFDFMESEKSCCERIKKTNYFQLMDDEFEDRGLNNL